MMNSTGNDSVEETNEEVGTSVGTTNGPSISSSSNPFRIKKKKVVRVLPVTPRNKLGRNEICPCRSGKKYKKCCLLKREYTPVAR